MDGLAGKRLLLIVAGGIAAYKTLDLVRRARERGASVRAILTRGGEQFVTPLSLAALTGEKVYQDLFSLTDEAEMGHIQLSRSADLIVVAPATADLMAKMANGHADDLATTTLLATDTPVLAAPAMNVRMWLHPATVRNLETLKARGVFVVGPSEGDMACGEYGPGRMAEPLDILGAATAILGDPPKRLALPVRPAPGGRRRLEGLTVLVTSGPTHEPIDPVRYIANRSSGRQGHAIAAAAAAEGARVVLVRGPVAIPDPPGVAVHPVETARQMLAAVEAALPVDIAVFAAAVADWRVDMVATSKLKKSLDAPPALALVENPDILSTIAHRREGRPGLVVGFAAETDAVLDQARAKFVRKGCDLLVANDVSPAGGVMGGEMNLVHLLSRDGLETWPRLEKSEVARRLVATFADHWTSRHGQLRPAPSQDTEQVSNTTASPL